MNEQPVALNPYQPAATTDSLSNGKIRWKRVLLRMSFAAPSVVVVCLLWFVSTVAFGLSLVMSLAMSVFAFIAIWSILEQESAKRMWILNWSVNVAGDAAAFHARAFRFLQSSQFDKAKTDANVAVSLDPQFIAAPLLLARIAVLTQDFETAIHQCQRIEAKFGENAEAKVLHSIALHNLGKSDKAEQLCELAISIDPENAEVNISRSLLYYACGGFPEALRYAKRATSYAPRDPAMRQMLALSLNGCQKYIQAFIESNALLQSDPRNQAMLQVRASTGFYVGKLRTAQSDCIKLLQIDPDDTIALLVTASLLAAKRDYNESLKTIDCAITTGKDLSYSYALQGAVQALAGDADAAYQSHRNSLDPSTFQQADADRTSALYRFALTQHFLGDYMRANETFDELVATDEWLPFCWKDYAWMLATCPDEEIRDHEQAVNWIEKAMTSGADRLAEWYVVQAAVLASTGDFSAAIQLQKIAIKKRAVLPTDRTMKSILNDYKRGISLCYPSPIARTYQRDQTI